MNYFNAKNGVFSSRDIIYAHWVDPKAIIIKYREERSASLFGLGSDNFRVRVEFETEEASQDAMELIRKTCGLVVKETV